MITIKVNDGTVNESHRKRMMHPSRRKIIDVLNNEYRKDIFSTNVITQSEREEQEETDAKRKEERSNIFEVRHSCPKCKRLFDKIDRKFYNRVNHCFNCQIKFETKLKSNGLFLEWEEMKLIQNELSIFKDHREMCEDALREIKPYTELITDAGLINKFEIADDQFQLIKADIQEDITFIEEKIPLMIERLAQLVDSLLTRDVNNIIIENDMTFKRIVENGND